MSDQIVAEGNATPGLQGLFNSSRVNTPWLYLDIDRTKCMAVGVSITSVFNTLQVYLGSYYVNNFNEFGRSWQVNVMADTRFRDRVDDIALIKVRNKRGRDGAAGHRARRSHDSSGPVALMRYNMYSATADQRQPGRRAPAPARRSQLMQEIAKQELPPRRWPSTGPS